MAKNETGKKETEKKRRYRSRDEYLDQAIEKLEDIDSGSHKDTALYQGVMDSIQRLHTITSRFYDSPIKTDTDLMQIRAAYEDVRAACDSYLEKNSGLHLHLYKKQREHGIRAIREIIEQDLLAMDPAHPAFSLDKNLKELLESGRRSIISLDDPGATHAVGGSASNRIPLALKKSFSGEERGFFTEHSKLENEQKNAEQIRSTYQKKIGVAKGEPDDDAQRSIYSWVAKQCNHGPFVLDRETDCATAEGFLEKYREVLKDLYGEHSSDDKSLMSKIQTRESREAIFDLCRDIYRTEKQRITAEDIPKIETGSSIATRNVAMSRMADLFGMKGLIAHAETVELSIGNRRVGGVFMQTAEGADLSQAKEGDPIAAVFKDRDSLAQGMDSYHVKSQLADLQVLDFLCGNTDRHERNLIYQMGKDPLGNPIVTGITGIDNDLSFGKLCAAGSMTGVAGSMVPPDSIQIMTRATYDTILGMTPQTLLNQLTDLGLSAKEQQAVVDRLNLLKARLAPANVVMKQPLWPTDQEFRIARNGIRWDPAHPNDMRYARLGSTNPVLVVPDEHAFNTISFADLAKGDSRSMFGQLAEAPESLSRTGFFSKNEGKREIRYAEATRKSAVAERAVGKARVRRSLRELRALSQADTAKKKTEKSAGGTTWRQRRKQASSGKTASAQKGTATV